MTRRGILGGILLLALGGCGVAREPDFRETVEVIPLPAQLGSYHTAHRIGTDVHDAVLERMQSNPDGYDSRRVGLEIKWGELQDLDTGVSTFYIKVIGKSIRPIEQQPAALELMRYAIDQVHRSIEATGTRVRGLETAASWPGHAGRGSCLRPAGRYCSPGDSA